MTMVSCSVCDCEDTRRNYPGKYTFHRLPSNPLLREKWLSVIRRVGWTQIRTPLGNYYGDYYNYNQDGRIDQVGYGYGGAMATVAMYYEALCPSCRQFDSSVFKQTVLELVPDLDINLCPYGNAKTIDNGFGGYEFVSQHGPAETYGNKLHACAIDVLQNITAAVVYNACLMDLSQAGRGSDDAAADMCGRTYNVNSEAIKQCAKADRGSQLLKYYGDESKKADINHVPTVLVNGVPVSTGNFKEEVYKAVY